MKKLNNRNFGTYFGPRQCSVGNDPSLPLTHLARGICIAIIAAWITCVPRAGAITFAGTSSGIFYNPTGGSGLVTTGNGTNFLTWGTGVGGTWPSWLYFAGTKFAGVAPGQAFWLGGLGYFNGTVLSGTEAYSANFRTSLAFTNPAGLTRNFDFNFQLINTLNTADPIASADSIFFSLKLPKTSFNVGGIDYTLELACWSVDDFSNIDRLNVLEGQTAWANLIGKVTANTPPSTPQSVPDPGSTLALMAMAVVGLGGLRQYLTARPD
jgi:hypothetical protein